MSSVYEKSASWNIQQVSETTNLGYLMEKVSVITVDIKKLILNFRHNTVWAITELLLHNFQSKEKFQSYLYWQYNFQHKGSPNAQCHTLPRVSLVPALLPLISIPTKWGNHVVSSEPPISNMPLPQSNLEHNTEKQILLLSIQTVPHD